MKHNIVFTALFLFCALCTTFSFAQQYQNAPNNVTATTPPNLIDLLNTDYAALSEQSIGGELEFQELDIRLDAMKEAAMSLGARAGLASRTFEIRSTLSQKEAYMDRVFDFQRLLVRAPSGLLIEPPVVSESFDALNIEDDGQVAAVADRILNINRNAKIVSVARNWRSYLERDWGEVQMPPSLLYPKTREEEQVWSRLLRQGWAEGTQQADAIFQADLNRLVSDFNGMVRYRVLLTQGIITPPFALEIDRGVTGGGSEMRVGDRAVQITGPSQLQPDALTWKPANR